jgi:hypothetical protein
MVNTAAVVAPMPVVTVPGMAARMPSIIDTTPAVIAQPCADVMSSWVNDNPLLALLGLGALALLVTSGGRNKR